MSEIGAALAIQTGPKELNTFDLKQAVELMIKSLTESTGLSEPSKKMVAYWTMATHGLNDPRLLTFPILALRGVMGSGKSQTCSVIENFAYRPKRITLDTSTLPTVRDSLAICREGTAVVEEGDHAWGDKDQTVERLFNCRYSRDTEGAALKVQDTDRNQHKTSTRKIFGATAIHKRESYRDPVLDTKSVTVLFRHNSKRDSDSYQLFFAEDSWNKDGHMLVTDRPLQLAAVKQLPHVAPRVFWTYRPVLSIASMVADYEFQAHLAERMHADTQSLIRSQGDEPENLVMNVLIEHILQETGFASDPIAINYLCEKLNKDNRKLDMTPYQFASHTREIGLRVQRSNGKNRIYPSVPDFLRACDKCCITTDEAVNELRRKYDGEISRDLRDAEKERKKEEAGLARLRTQSEEIATPLLKTKDIVN